MKVRGRLVGRAKLVIKKHRETKFIYSTGLIGRMIFCNVTDRRLVGKDQLIRQNDREKNLFFRPGLLAECFYVMKVTGR